MVRRIGRWYSEAFLGLPGPVWRLCVGLLINRAGTMVLPFLSLYLVRRLGLQPATASTVLVAYGVGSLAGSYLGGDLSGRFGPIRVQRWSLALAGASYLLLGQVRTPGLLVVVVFLSSLVADAFRPACMAAVLESAPPHLQPRALGLVRLAANLGMGIGPALGGLLASIDYAWLFVGDALTCWAAALWLVVSLRTMGPIARDSRRSVARQRELLRDGPFLAFLGMMLCLATMFFQFIYTVPLYLVEHVGFDEKAAGLVFAFNASLIVVIEMPLIRALERRDPARVLAGGIVLMCGGLGMLGLAHSTMLVFTAATVWTFGEMLCLPFSNLLAARRGGPDGAGPAMGMYTAVYSLATITAPAAGLWVYHRIGPEALWFGIGLLGIPLALSARALAPYFAPRSGARGVA